MTTCPNCYNTSTSTPCGSVGCLSINYAKCIFYSGPSLTCEFGGIGSFTFTGVSAGATSETLIFNSQGGSGTGATFAVTTTLGSTEYQVAVVNPGSGYTEGDVLTIPFTFANALSSNWEDITANWEDILDTFGGTSSPGNSITLTVTAVAGVVNNGDNLDNVIRDLHERICLISSNGVQGLDYSGFDYSCLRQGGILTGTGTAITSASEFTEATAAALCSLNNKVKALEAPYFTVPSCLSSVLTSNSSSLSSILTEYGNLLCIHNTNLDLSGVGLAPPCINYAFTTAPTSNNVADYISWITANMCGMFNVSQDDISAESARISALYTYITGGTAGTVPASIDTSCLTGGSASMSLKNAVVLIKDRLCALTTTVAGLSNPNITLNWGCLTTGGGGGLTQSPYSLLPAFTNTTSLTTHLTYITQALVNLRMNFSNEFSLNSISSSCGSYWNITLQNANADDFFVYDGSWVGKSLTVKLNGSTVGVTKTVTGTSVNFDLAVGTSAITINGTGITVTHTPGTSVWNLSVSRTTALVSNATNLPLGTFSITPGPFYTQLPYVSIYGSRWGHFSQNQQILVENISGTTQTLSDTLAATPCMNLLTLPVNYTPTAGNTTYYTVFVKHYSSTSVFKDTYICTVQIAPTTPSGMIVALINNSGANIVMAANDYFIISLDTIQWTT